jgi:hypothetical protein
MTIFWTIFIIVFYFSPSITAHQRHTRNKSQVTILNVLLGWTILGWIIAFIMAYSPDVEVKK